MTQLSRKSRHLNCIRSTNSWNLALVFKTFYLRLDLCSQSGCGLPQTFTNTMTNLGHRINDALVAPPDQEVFKEGRKRTDALFIL